MTFGSQKGSPVQSPSLLEKSGCRDRPATSRQAPAVKGVFQRQFPKGKCETARFRMQASYITASDWDERGLQGSPQARHRAKVTGMKAGSETTEKPSVEGDGAGDGDQVRRLRLHGFLRELVREEGRMEAAELLGVNYKTLVRAEESGHLTTHMSHALERLLLSGESPGADDARVAGLERRLARLERGVEALAEELRDGLEELRRSGAVGVGKRAVRQGAVEAPAGGRGGVPGSEPVIGLRAGSGRLRGDVIAEEPAAGDRERYGAAWSLVEEWRRLRKDHPHGGKGLEWLSTEERLLTLELGMLGEHGLTLPPETRPLRGAGRVVQTDWRRTALADIRRARVWGEVRWRARRVVVVGLLLALSVGAVLLEGCGAAAALT